MGRKVRSVACQSAYCKGRIDINTIARPISIYLSIYVRTFCLSPLIREPRSDPRKYIVTTTPNRNKCAVNNSVNNSTVARLIQKTISPHPSTTCLAVQPSKDSSKPRRSRSSWGSFRTRGSQNSSSPSGSGASGARPCWLERAPRA